MLKEIWEQLTAGAEMSKREAFLYVLYCLLPFIGIVGFGYLMEWING